MNENAQEIAANAVLTSEDTRSSADDYVITVLHWCEQWDYL